MALFQGLDGAVKSSISTALTASSNTDLAAFTRAGAGAVVSVITSRNVVTASLAACCKRPVACWTAWRLAARYAPTNGGSLSQRYRVRGVTPALTATASTVASVNKAIRACSCLPDRFCDILRYSSAITPLVSVDIPRRLCVFSLPRFLGHRPSQNGGFDSRHAVRSPHAFTTQSVEQTARFSRP